MKRRNFLKTACLSLITTNLLFKTKAQANQNFDSNNKNVIEFYCMGGADFRYLFAPKEEGEYKDLYLSKQKDIINTDEYTDITVDGKTYLIREDASFLNNLMTNNKVAIIPNTWFSPTRNHAYSAKKALLGQDTEIKPSNFNDTSWLGYLSGYTSKNIIQLSPYFSYSCNVNAKDGFLNTQRIAAINTRPFGIQNNQNFIDKALQRFFNNYDTNSDNKIVNNFVKQEKNLVQFSNQINENLLDKNPVMVNTTNGGLNTQIRGLFDCIDSKDIFNSSNYYIGYGSFDFHNDFRSLNDRFTNVFGKDMALETMVKELKNRKMWEDTVIVVFSEFGRQLRQNGRAGKDHGHGNLMFVIGGDVNGGIYGDMFPESEIPKWKSSAGHDIEGLTNGLSVFAQITDFISPGLGDIIFPSRDIMITELDKDIYPLFNI